MPDKPKVDDIYSTYFPNGNPPSQEDIYVAWCRYTNKTIQTCDSDAPHAFKVYRWPGAYIESVQRQWFVKGLHEGLQQGKELGVSQGNPALLSALQDMIGSHQAAAC